MMWVLIFLRKPKNDSGGGLYGGPKLNKGWTMKNVEVPKRKGHWQKTSFPLKERSERFHSVGSAKGKVKNTSRNTRSVII